MSTSWAIGFMVGLALVAIVSIVLKKAGKGKGGCKGEFDERQLAARGKAFTWAYATIMIYLAVWMILRSLEVPFFMEALSVLMGALISIAVFVGYCIFHDAYFKASESPRAWLLLLCGAGLLNVIIGLRKLLGEGTIRERFYENMNLPVGGLLVITLVCLVIKKAVDKRSEGE